LVAGGKRERDHGAGALPGGAPVVVHTLRLPKKAAASVLAACDEGRRIGPAHVATSAIEAKP
jgi:hypothetical protein